MKINEDLIYTGSAALFMLFAGSVIGATIYKSKKGDAELNNIKNEIMEKDYARYTRTMEKAGNMTDSESKIFVWKQAIQEMNDSLRKAASVASTNYAKGSLIK